MFAALASGGGFRTALKQQGRSLCGERKLARGQTTWQQLSEDQGSVSFTWTQTRLYIALLLLDGRVRGKSQQTEIRGLFPLPDCLTSHDGGYQKSVH